ncbi:MAG: potassium channel family protein [Muribaculum sp.]|nr:potassium channel family protein [Muribaculum sp.]
MSDKQPSADKKTPYWNTPFKRRLRNILHWMVLFASIALIVLISWDAFNNISFVSSPTYRIIEFWICIFFIFDVIAEMFLYPPTWRNIIGHGLFLLVSIPYSAIIHHYNIHLSAEIAYLVQLVPMIRTAYVLVIVLSAFTSNRISGLFVSYLALLMSVIYFSSLMFYIEEHFINPGVTSYWASLWWAFMCCNTVGSNITPITHTGVVLEIVLSLAGLILFPVFTVYITNALTSRKNVKPNS